MESLSPGILHGLGVGRFLESGVVNFDEATRGVFPFWDKRILDLVNMEI